MIVETCLFCFTGLFRVVGHRLAFFGGRLADLGLDGQHVDRQCLLRATLVV